MSKNYKKNLSFAIMIILSALLFSCTPKETESTLVFNTNGGDYVGNMTYQWGTPATLPITPIREGYLFDGWFFDSLFTTPFTEGLIINGPQDNVIVIYAKWTSNISSETSILEEIYQLAINNQQFEGSFTDWIESFSVPKEIPGTEGNQIVFRIENHIMQWKYVDGDEWVNLYDASRLTKTGDSDKKELVLRVNDGSIEFQYVSDDQWIILISIDALNGLSVYHLYMLVNPNYEKNENDWLIDLVNDQLNENLSWNATFDYNDGITLVNVVKVGHLAKLTQPNDPIREGYQFTGWYYRNEKWSFIGYVVTEDMVLKAKWNPINYSIAYRLNDGLFVNPDQIVYSYSASTKPLLLSEPKRDGYLFDGWFLESTFENAITTIDSNIFEDLILHAKWTINQYTLTLITEFTETHHIIYNYQEMLNLPQLEYTEYTFDGWYLDEDFLQENIHEKMPPNNLILYGKWQGNIMNLWTYQITEESATIYTVEVRIKGFVNIAGFDITIYYDGQELIVDSIQNPLGAVINNNNLGYIILNYVNANNPINKETVVLRLQFSKVITTISPLSLRVKDIIAIDQEYNIYKVEYNIEVFEEVFQNE